MITPITLTYSIKLLFFCFILQESNILQSKTTKMSGNDEVCYIQKWDLDYQKAQGMLHLRTKDSREKRIVNISFKDHDYLQANARFRKYRVFFLKPWMKNSKEIHKFNHGSAFRSHQNADFVAKSLLFKMAMQQTEELKAKNGKMQLEWNLKYQKMIQEKDDTIKKLQQYFEKRVFEKSNEQKLQSQVRRLNSIIEEINRANLSNRQQNNVNDNRYEHENMFEHY